MEEDCPQVKFDIIPSFREYYRNILVPSQMSDFEYENMINMLQTPLPLTFRLSQGLSHFDRKINEIREVLQPIIDAGYDCGELEFLPKEFGSIFQVNVPVREIRHTELFVPFRTWLRESNQRGDCHLQELVSMIPHSFLSINPDMAVLDMCAAPGSKTSQIVESLDADKGFVVANDADLKRCFTLVHQVKRVGLYNVLITNFSGQSIMDFPCQFDRVLCDVPCSGDGTLRKNEKGRGFWKNSRGTAHHGLQRSLLKRSLEVLKVGGICVYSTCSMNPIENEAVVGSVVEEFGQSVQILDQSHLFPGLKRHGGMCNWSVYDNPEEAFIYYPVYEAVPPVFRNRISSTMFPITKNIGLEKCMRFYPQDMNCGGFFVAVIQKMGESIPRNIIPKKMKNFGEDPFIPLVQHSLNDALLIKESFGLGDDFPLNQLFIRNLQNWKHVYMMSKSVSQIVSTLGSETLRLISGGLVLFTKKKMGGSISNIFYPSSEGSFLLKQYNASQSIEMKPIEIYQLVEAGHKGMKIDSFSLETQERIRRCKQNGAIYWSPEINMIYGGLVFESSAAIYIREDLIQFQMKKIVYESGLKI